MTWKPLLDALDRGQRENDVSLLLVSLRRIMAHLSLVNGVGTNSLFIDNASKSEIETVFAESSKLLAFKHPLVRKLAGWILLIIGNNNCFENRELYLLAVNSLVASGTSNPDYLTRGKALTVSCQLGHGSRTGEEGEGGRVGASCGPDLKQSALKDCEYVRRLAVLFAGDDSSDANIDALVGLVESESDPVVLLNVIVVLAGTEKGASRLTKEVVLSALTKLSTFPESNKASFITILTELTDRCKVEWADEDVLTLLNLLDGCLEGGESGGASILLASGFLLRLIDASSLDMKADLRSQLFDRFLPSLWKLLETNGPEVAHQAIDFLTIELSRNPCSCSRLIRDGIEWAHVSPRDPAFLVLKKIELLVQIASSALPSGGTTEGQRYSALLHAILSQIFVWTTTTTRSSKIAETSLVAVTRIQSLSVKTLLEVSDRVEKEEDVKGDLKVDGPDEKDGCQAVFRRCMNHVIGLLDQPSPVIVASALNALKEALQEFDEFSIDVAKDATEDKSLCTQESIKEEIDKAGEAEGFLVGPVKDAMETSVTRDNSLEDDAAQSKTYLRQLLVKIPGCILIIRKTKLPLREKAISAILFFLERYSWAVHPSASPAYILEDLYSNHFDSLGMRKLSSKLKAELLSTATKLFSMRPNQTLPLLKEIISVFDRDPDMFLSLNSHKLFHLLDSF